LLLPASCSDPRPNIATILVTTEIEAPLALCFDLARDVDLHVQSQAPAEERAVGGRTSGLIELGETVTWEARHLGIRQRFTSKVTAFEPPRYFQDTMVKGAFKSFVHDHFFERSSSGEATIMTDRLTFELPLGIIGRLFNVLVLNHYMEALLRQRARAIERAAKRLVGGTGHA